MTLIRLTINDIIQNINYPINANLFADDFNSWCKSENLGTVQYFLDVIANKLIQAVKVTGFKFLNYSE